MRGIRGRCAVLLPVAVLAMAALPARAQSDDASGYADGYQQGDYGRVRYTDNGATIIRAASDEASGPVSVNVPIFPGDTLRTGRDQRVEVQLASGTIVRIGGDTEIVFQSLPDPYAKFEDNSVLALNSGVLRIAARVSDKQEFRIDTDASSVYLLSDGDFRIDAAASGTTRVASYRGVAEVGGADGSVLVRGGEVAAVDPGLLPSKPVAFRASNEDAFDRWCDAREGAYRPDEAIAGSAGTAVEPQDLPVEVRPYYGELSAYGTWTVVPDYGYVWYPQGVSAGWRPYYDGRWAYGPAGYFWVSSEPWGWAPYHYGCWQWVPAHGWCWVPGRVFAGAWVSWSWGSLYVGWAPLNYWGRPCWTGGPRFFGHYDPHCWTFVGYDRIAVRNVRRYAVPVSRVGVELERARIVTRAPRVAPRLLERSPEWRRRALTDVDRDRGARLGGPAFRSGTGERSFIERQSRLLPRERVRTGTEGPRGPRAATERARPSRPEAPSARTGVRSRETSRPAAEPHERYPRRITRDPRQGEGRTQAQGAEARPGAARDNVRKFYERMSRPRVTREPDKAGASRETPSKRTAAPRRTTPESRYKAPQPRYQTPQPRYKAPEPRYKAPQPRYKAPQPRYKAPQPRAQRPDPPRQPAPKAAPRSQPRPQHSRQQQGRAHPKKEGGGKKRR